MMQLSCEREETRYFVPNGFPDSRCCQVCATRQEYILKSIVYRFQQLRPLITNDMPIILLIYFFTSLPNLLVIRIREKRARNEVA